jgi:hypothetical protein
MSLLATYQMFLMIFSSAWWGGNCDVLALQTLDNMA